MIHILYFIISLLSSAIGGICGVGGGVIIKPVLDATGTMSVSNISFLSGCTVLCMSLVSVLRNRKNTGLIEFRIGTPLALGAVAGGFAGKSIFDFVKGILENNSALGLTQTIMLIAVTAATFIYDVAAERIKTREVSNFVICCLIGLLLGLISSFLGIGGGPINLMVLSYFFSMGAKKAAANSLYIILLSQFASLIQTLIASSMPTVDPSVIALMSLAGVTGAFIGSCINKKISDRGVNGLFKGFMLIIIGVCIYNAFRFSIQL